jgi:uncharacterized protein
MAIVSEMTSEPFPRFRFHSDPIATGSARPSESPCRCCGFARGFVVGGVYSTHHLDDSICPWCVADGSAAERFDASFVQDVEVPVSADDYREVLERTPGYTSWQGENWLVHCGVPMVFHGDISKAELHSLRDKDREKVIDDYPFLFDGIEWSVLVEDYEPGGQPAFYKFTCFRCGTLRLGCDFT